MHLVLVPMEFSASGTIRAVNAATCVITGGYSGAANRRSRKPGDWRASRARVAGWRSCWRTSCWTSHAEVQGQRW